MRSLPSAVILLSLVSTTAAVAGDLEPPGPPAPTMRTLDEVESRVPIRAADLPLTISSSGSYYFVSNIDTAGAGITVAANEVTIDLMGFSLTGGTDHGITASIGTQGITVRNGRISGWSAHGVDLLVAKRVLVRDIHTHGNGGNGMRVGESSAVVQCIASGNGVAGITADSGSLISGNVVYDNTLGIQALFGATLSGNAVYRNMGDGIIASSSATLIGNNSYQNDDRGIVAGTGSTLIGNTSNENNDGLVVTGPSLLDQNTTVGNADSNISCAPSCVFGINQDPTAVALTLDDVKTAVDGVAATVAQTDTAVSGIDGKVDTLLNDSAALQNTTDPRTRILAADLPLTIAGAGSYYLAESVVTASGGITINASDVTLDLGGFTLAGGTGDGIVSGVGTRNISVINGTVSGWAGDGIDLATATLAVVAGVRVDGNTGTGVVVGDDGVVSGVIAAANGADGIRGGAGTGIRDSSAVANSGDGIACGADECAIRRNVARGNSGDGVRVAGGATVVENVVAGNGAGAADGAGVHATGNGNRLDGNTADGNDRGIDVDGTGNVVVRNVAGGNGVDYDVAGGNDFPAPGTAATATNPWGNVDN